MGIDDRSGRAQRHARQLILPGWGPRAQARVADARVLVVGAGGLGSPALLYLAAAGVGSGSGRLGVLDDDAVDLTNLHRQILHGTADEGRPKTDSARDALLRLDPGAHIEPHAVRLDAGNAEGVLGGYDLVLDGTDNFPTRYLVNDTCARLGIPLVWGALQAFAGQVGVAAPGHACYRCVFPAPPAPGLVPACGDIGVLGSVCASIAAVQVTEALKLLGGVGEPLTDRVLVHDALAMTWEQVPVARRPGCVCGGGAAAAVGEACAAPPRPAARADGDLVTPAELADLVRAGGVRVVDVRSAAERAVVAVPGSEHVPLDAILDGSPLPFGPQEEVVLVCRAGVRSHTAAEALAQRGQHARELDGGILAWVRDITEWDAPMPATPAGPAPTEGGRA